MTLPYPTIYARVKAMVADMTGLEPGQIKAKMRLAERPLFFTARGLRALARKLNASFSEPPLRKRITASQTGRAKTVQSLADLVKEAYE